MKVFISYSVDDIQLVNQVADSIRPKAELKYWENSHHPEADTWPQLFNWIDECELVLVIITDKTLKRAMSVGQEISHAKKAGKRIIPLVSNDVAEDLRFLSDMDFIPLDTSDTSSAVDSLHREVDRLTIEASQMQAGRLASLQNGIATLAGIALISGLLSSQLNTTCL